MLDKCSIKPIIEALIFAGESPLSFDRLTGVLEGEDKAVIREALKELIEDYRQRAGGLLIEEVAGGYQIRTNPEFAPWMRRLFKIGAQKMSKAAMETLAVIAYRQPVTRAEVELIRGVDSGGVMATLMDKRFIKITGRKEAPGRPVVYGTTREFLEAFDLKDLSCLPSLKDMQTAEEELGSGEASQDIGQSGGGVPEEGRGDDSAGQGEGEPAGGDGAGDQGRP